MRRYTAQRDENSRFSWLARNLGSFIAAGYQIEQGKENMGLKLAGQLAYDDIEAAILGASTSAGTSAPKENGNGSFERFMMMAGQLDQRGKML